jgi:Zn-dependent metalloprotease
VGGQAFGAEPELVVLPMSDGYHLAYFGRATANLEIVNVFIDADSGGLLRQYSDFLSEVGAGTGTYGDNKKVSTTSIAGSFIADDKLRPTEITTFDAKGNFARAQALILGQTPSIVDIASSASNNWNDGAVVDAHVYAGLYYDYLFKRFGRHGLDNRDLRIDLLTHTVRLADIATAPPNVLGLYYINAFYSPSAGPNGQGLMVFGEGAPTGFLAPNLEVKPFSAAFDVVAHELTHGVTGNSARLNGFPLSEAGALNEGFSDIFGVSTAFFFQPVGPNALQASYLTGRDLTVPSGVLSRSMSNPASTGDPDHYTRRIIGGDPHYNSTILSHAFYLAIEGGANRTSGISVQGVGPANREQIEKAFFRALTALLPSSATFALTRAATIQAARDLYGTGGAVERAITQAFDAVGVQPRTAPTAAIVPVPITPAQCPRVSQPSWGLYVTMSAGASDLVVNQWQLDSFDAAGVKVNTDASPPVGTFASSFNFCGPGSNRVLAQNDACAAPCIGLGAGRTSGSVQVTFTATDDANRTMTFSSPRVTLSR